MGQAASRSHDTRICFNLQCTITRRRTCGARGAEHDMHMQYMQSTKKT